MQRNLLNIGRAVANAYVVRPTLAQGRTDRRSWATAFIAGSIAATVIGQILTGAVGAELWREPDEILTPTDIWHWVAILCAIEISHRMTLWPVCIFGYARRRRDAGRRARQLWVNLVPLVWLLWLPISALRHPTDETSATWDELDQPWRERDAEERDEEVAEAEDITDEAEALQALQGRQLKL